MTDDSAPLESPGVDVAPGVRIPGAELSLRAVSASGPGGQHVNRSATRIELRWNVRSTRALSQEQQARVTAKLSSRIDGEGFIRIVAGEYRSQQQNRKAATERLVSILGRALIVAPPRKATRPTRASVHRRLDEKRKRSDTKNQRRRESDD